MYKGTHMYNTRTQVRVYVLISICGEASFENMQGFARKIYIYICMYDDDSNVQCRNKQNDDFSVFKFFRILIFYSKYLDFMTYYYELREEKRENTLTFCFHLFFDCVINMLRVYSFFFFGWLHDCMWVFAISIDGLQIFQAFLPMEQKSNKIQAYLSYTTFYVEDM